MFFSHFEPRFPWKIQTEKNQRDGGLWQLKVQQCNKFALYCNYITRMFIKLRKNVVGIIKHN